MKNLLIMDRNYNTVAVGKLADLAQTDKATTVFVDDVQIHSPDVEGQDVALKKARAEAWAEGYAEAASRYYEGTSISEPSAFVEEATTHNPYKESDR